MVEQKTTLELKLEKLRDICEKSPEHHIGLLALAETAFRRGLRLEALEAYQKVLGQESVAEAHLCMAQMYRHHGLLAEAIAELRVLFELEPGYPEAVVFASELANETELPEDLQAVVVAGCGNDELALAKVRLSIARSLVLREGQELMAIQEANAGDPTFGYYIGETRKRLVYCEQVLSQLGHLEEARRTFQQEQARLREVSAKHASASLVEELPVDLAQATPTEVEDVPVHPLFPPSDQLGTEEQPSLSQLEEVEAATESDYRATASEEFDVITEPVVEEVIEPSLTETPAEQELPVATPELWADPPLVAEQPVEPVAARLEDGPPLPSWGESVELEPELPRDVPPVGELWDDLPRPLLPEPARPAQEDLGLGLGLDLVPQMPMDLPAISEPEIAAPETILNTVSEPEIVPMGHLGDDLLAVSVAVPEVQIEMPPIPVVEEAQAAEHQPVEAQPDAFPEPAEVEPIAVISATPVDFGAVYAGLLGQLDTLMQTLAKTRSVSSVYLVNREGYCIVDIAKDSLSSERLHEFICETVAFLETYAASPQYWVLECAGGIVVIQSVDSYHFLVTIGQSGANFGALRFTMDRIRPSFAEALSSALPADH